MRPGGQPIQRGAHLFQPQPDVAGGADEREPAQHRPLVAPLLPAGTRGLDEPGMLVITQGRCGKTTALSDLADGQQIVRVHRLHLYPESPLDLKFTSSTSIASTRRQAALGGSHEHSNHYRRIAGFRARADRRTGRDGWTVIATGRDTDRLAATEDLDPAHLVTLRGDVREPEHQRALITAADRSGGLDLLVHNASTLGPSPLPSVASLPPQELTRIFDVNVLAPLALTRLALPLLLGSPQPALVSLSSDAAVEAYEGWGGYGSSKAALDQLMAVLAAEQPTLAVYAFDPGDMRTAMHQRAFPGEDISDRPEPETVVPALLDLLRERPASGRYRAADRTAVPA